MRWLFFLSLICLVMGLAIGVSAQDGSDATAFVREVVELTNQARTEEGLPPLALNEALSAAAQGHAEAMAAGDFFAHEDPRTGSIPSKRITAAGYAWQEVAENLAAGAETPAEAITDWLASPGHQANILNPDFQEIGVGYIFEADDEFPSAATPHQTYWVQTFGTPANATSQTDSSPVTTSDGLVTITVSVSPESVQVGESFTVEVQLSGQSSRCVQSAAGQPVDVVLVLDNSSSMTLEGFDEARLAALDFINEIDFSTARVGVVKFQNNADLVHPLDSNQTAVTNAINGVSMGYSLFGTSVSAGLRTALDELQAQGRSEAAAVIVILSDGGDDFDEAIAVADTAKAAGVQIISVGLASVREDLMRAIAATDEQGNPRYYYSPDSSSLRDIYTDIGRTITERVLASDFSLRYQVDQQNFTVLTDSLISAGTLSDDTVIWQRPFLTDGDNAFTFQLQGVESGTYDFTRLVEASYLECGQDQKVIRISDGPLITVQGSPTPTPAATPTPPLTATLPVSPTAGQFVTMTITANPESASVDEAITVQITVSGQSDQCGQSIVAKPVDVILVLDRSGSMSGMPLQQAKAAAKAFVREIDFNNDRVGVVEFSDGANLVHPLDTKETAVTTAIDSIDSGGGTAIHAGLQVTFEHLHDNLRDEATPVIVILSDGQSDRTAAQRVADTAKAAGMKIASVGLGDGIDAALLESIASLDAHDQPQYYESPDGSDLEQIYITIARNIREYGLASDLTLRHQLALYDFFVVPESLNPPGQITGDTIIWEQGILEDGDTIFTFQVRPREAGEVDIGRLTEAIFLECEQTPRTIQLPPGPHVVIAGQPEAPPDVPFPCESWQLFPWWVLVPLLLLLLILLFLFLTPWGRRLWRKLMSKPLLCRLLALLTTLYLLFLAALIARALIGDLCRVDQVYFWKITSDGNVGIYESDFGRQTGRDVGHLNADVNCVACHSGTSATQRLAAVQNDQNGPVIARTLDGAEVTLPLINGSYTTWSPDGRQMAISLDDQDIYILDVETGSLTPLAGASEPDVIETMPAWSADGQTIAFVRTTSTAPDDPARVDAPADIYTVPATGSTALPLIGASGAGFNYYPAYSPDGRWLAFTRHENGNDTYADEAADIYLVPAGGGEPIYLRANSEAADSWPSWSPDGRWLGFNSNRLDDQFDVLVTEITQAGQSSQVYRLPAAATPTDEEFRPVWISPPVRAWWERLLALWPWLLPLLLLLLLGWLLCRERKYILSGQVTNAVTREPIPGAEIKIIEPPLPNQTTDGRGRYRVQLPAGPVALSATAPGYVGQSRGADVKDDTTLDFRLYPLVKERRELPLPPPLPEWTQPPVWQPDPTLIIGLGGTGRHVLTHLKKNLRDAGAGTISDRVRLVLFDTADYELLEGQEVAVSFAGVTLTAGDVVEFGDDLSDLLRSEDELAPEIRDWFPAAEYNTRLSEAELDLSLGTRQRRPPARAALVLDVRQGEASRLWRLLIKEANAALDENKRLRVIIVGSLAGGFGSATVADIAYLARRAGQSVSARSISIEAYLATNGAFSRVVTRPDVHAANTYASLRELERFQLAQGYPFRMIYDYDAAGDRDLGEVLAGAINWRLLDEIYLYDTPPNLEPANEAQERAYYDPTAGIFPAMADAISLWLDKASRVGALAEYRRTVQGSVTGEQLARGRAVVGGAGAFVYRLPMYDLIAQLKARWARALIRQIIIGDDPADLRLDPKLNREENPGAVAEHVHQFLVGLAGYTSPSCPATTTLIGLLEHEGFSPAFLEKLAETEIGHQEGEVSAYRAYLAGAVTNVLNGAATSTAQVARSGKLGYGITFLENVFKALRRATEELQLKPPDLPEETTRKVDELETLLPRLAEVTREQAEVVRRLAGQLSQRLRSGNSQDSSPGLFERLDALEREYADLLTEMDTVLVRQYVHPPDLLERWYATYLADDEFLDDALQRVYWQRGPGGDIQLAIRTWQEQPTVLKPGAAGLEEFIDELMQLAAYATKDIWRSETLATVLAQTALHPDRIEETVARLQAGSLPLLQYDEFKADHSLWRLVLGVNPTVEEAKALEAALKIQLPTDRKLTTLAITDPYTLLLTQTVDVVPLGAIGSVTEAEQAYRRWYGLLPRVTADPRAEPTSVFRAEKIALMLEQRLQPELRQAARLLRPIIVTALDGGGVARLYALAYAASWVRRGGDNVVRVHLPDGTIIPLTTQADYDRQRPEHVFAVAFVRFVFLPAGQIREVQAALHGASDDTIAAWQAWAGPDWRQHPLVAPLLAGGPDAADLATVITLVVRDELKRWQEQWS